METTTIAPRVYVGTYKKYNEGNLGGGWIDLSTCETYKDFLSKCRNLHRGESDPEYMIQDCEHFPDGLSCMEWLTEQDFNDVKAAMQEGTEESPYKIVDYSERAIAVVGDTKPIAGQLKALGGRFNFRLSCGAGWVFPKTKESEVRAMLGGSCGVQSAAPSKDDAAMFRQEYLTYVDQIKDTDYWKDYYRKCKDIAVKLADGWCVISKPSIDNKFCFHDEGPQYEFYKKLMADESKLRSYFLSENLSAIDKEIEELKKDEPLYTRPLSNNAVEVLNHYAIYSFYEYRQGKKEPRQITAEERATLLHAYGIVRADFEKRLQAYLKRYGVSKLHVWTYWADR